MKTCFRNCWSFVWLVLLPVSLPASEDFRLATEVLVFKHGEFQRVELPKVPPAPGRRAVVFTAPATVRFDQEALLLKGGTFEWSSGPTPPRQFTRIATPVVPFTLGKPVTLLSTVPVQYLEKTGDGALQVREISAASPDAPHWRLTFTLAGRVAEGGALRVVCDLDVATVKTRERIAGLALEVGKPVLGHFVEKFALIAVPEEWSGFVVQALNDGDSSLLVLLKAVRAPQASSPTTPAREKMTAAQFVQFASSYYRDPRPELIAQAIESLGPTRFLNRGDVSSYLYHQSGYTCVGFFAEVFAANPERVPAWRELVERRGQDGETRFWLRKALESPRPLMAFDGGEAARLSQLEQNYVLEGAFFASGDPAYLRKLIERVALVDEAQAALFDAGAEAMMFFASNAPLHPGIGQTLRAARDEARPRTRELIDDLLSKTSAAVLQQIQEMDKSGPLSDSPAHGRNYLPWRRSRPAQR